MNDSLTLEELESDRAMWREHAQRMEKLSRTLADRLHAAAKERDELTAAYDALVIEYDACDSILMTLVRGK